LLNVVITDNNL